jgi:CRISPR system Cascade subunit CasA
MRRTVVFDLLEEPWIPVVSHDGRLAHVGLAGLLRDAHQFGRLAGQTPPMTAALYRLVLAFAHRVYGPANNEQWADLWKPEHLPQKPLRDYIAKHRPEFDLFSRERPFLQCPDLASRPMSSTAGLVAYRSCGSNVTLFDHTTSSDRPLLEPAEAARWLVTLHAYDPGGTKTPYEKARTSERGLCNLFGCVLLEGATVKETLLLNMLFYDPDRERPRNTTFADHPAWEEADPPSPYPEPRPPRGWTDVLTWPSRRVLLSHRVTPENDCLVDGAVITPGTGLRGELVDVEFMAAYGRTSATGKKAPGRWHPVRMRQRRGVWRHTQELLLAGGKDQRYERRRPRAVEQLADLAATDLIAANAVYTLRVIGQELDSNGGGSVCCWFDQTVPAPVALLRARDTRIGALVGLAVKLADDIGHGLSGMERDYAKALRDRHPSADLELAYWPHLDDPFAMFLQTLSKAVQLSATATTAYSTALDGWAAAVRALGRGAADRWAYVTPRRDRYQLEAAAHYDRFLNTLDYRIARFRAAVLAFTAPGEAA